MSKMLIDIKKDIIERFGKLGNLKLSEPLSNYTSFKTGGPADVLISPYNTDFLKEILLIAAEKSLPITIIGGCSNLLVGDKGIRGVVVKLSEVEGIKGKIEITKDGLVYSDAIIKKKDFIRFCVDEDFAGMEFMAGIPGCIGGGIIMNAGISDSVFVDILDSIVYMDKNGNVSTKKITRDMASYRSLNIENDTIVLGGFFSLNRSHDTVKVKKKIEANISDREIKHPLDWPSAGSVFKNPPGRSSWQLIDEAGLKGKKIGGAVVSDLHTNFIINVDSATSSDIRDLVNHVKDTVYSKFNVMLETEIRFLGEF